MTNDPMDGKPKVGDRCWCLWEPSDALNLGFGVVPPWEGVIVEASGNTYRVAPLDELGLDTEEVLARSKYVTRDARVTLDHLRLTEADARDAYIENLSKETAQLEKSLAEKRAELQRWEQTRDADSSNDRPGPGPGASEAPASPRGEG